MRSRKQRKRPGRGASSAESVAGQTAPTILVADGHGDKGAGQADGRADRGRYPEGQAAPASGRRALINAWVDFLAPNFPNGSCYFTGTYSDEYGTTHGLMLIRNVVKDFTRFLKELGLDESAFVIAVERHKYRDILHLHAIINGGDLLKPEQYDFLKRWWSLDRGHARSLPVTDGCLSYVTKYALKEECESIEWSNLHR